MFKPKLNGYKRGKKKNRANDGQFQSKRTRGEHLRICLNKASQWDAKIKTHYVSNRFVPLKAETTLSFSLKHHT